MGIQIIRQSATTSDLQDQGTVAVPLSAPACALRGVDVSIAGRPAAETGLWECSPGKFQRQVASGEVMHILAGQGCFFSEAEGAQPVDSPLAIRCSSPRTRAACGRSARRCASSM